MRVRSPLARLRPWLVPTACFAWASYFAFHAIVGETGLMALGGYRAERSALDAHEKLLATRKAVLDHRYALLDPRHVDPDLADELVRDQLGVVRKDEVVVPLKQGD